MTENKRFKADKYNFEIWDDDSFLLSFDQTVDLLNTFNDENEKLKKDCTVLVYHNQEYRKENEQLKKENKKLNCIIKQLEEKYEDKGFLLAYDMGECE